MVLSPIQTQIAFITPVCCCEGSRAWYMKRQMIPAPMNEIAIGRKINDLAAFSALRPVGEHGDGEAEHGRQ